MGKRISMKAGEYYNKEIDKILWKASKHTKDGVKIVSKKVGIKLGKAVAKQGLNQLVDHCTTQMIMDTIRAEVSKTVKNFFEDKLSSCTEIVSHWHTYHVLSAMDLGMEEINQLFQKSIGAAMEQGVFGKSVWWRRILTGILHSVTGMRKGAIKLISSAITSGEIVESLAQLITFPQSIYNGLTQLVSAGVAERQNTEWLIKQTISVDHLQPVKHFLVQQNIISNDWKWTNQYSSGTTLSLPTSIPTDCSFKLQQALDIFANMHATSPRSSYNEQIERCKSTWIAQVTDRMCQRIHTELLKPAISAGVCKFVDVVAHKMEKRNAEAFNQYQQIRAAIKPNSRMRNSPQKQKNTQPQPSLSIEVQQFAADVENEQVAGSMLSLQLAANELGRPI